MISPLLNRAATRLVATLARAGALIEPWALPALTLVACVVRASGLPIVQGTLQRDESRLAMAARGILEHGVPLLPGGVVYTRGIVPAYVEAGVFAVFGVSDQSARLQALVVGTLLVPATYWLAAAVVGRWTALGAATIVAFSPHLVTNAREAWLYPWLALGFVVALGALLRWYRRPQLRLRLLAALAFTLAIFSHELAALFLPIAAVADLWLLWRKQTGVPWRHLLAFWSIVTVSTLLVLTLALVLRAPTAAGSMAEFRDHLRLSLDTRGLLLTLRLFGTSQPWLLPAAALGLAAVAVRGARGLRVIAGVVFLAIIVLLTFDAFLLARRGRVRDIQVLIPLVAVAATYGVSRCAPRLSRALTGWPGPRAAGMVGATLVLILTIASISPQRLSADALAQTATSTWVQAVSDRDPNDLVMTYGPTNAYHYLGRADFWLRPIDYAKYVWAGPPPYRDIQTGAIVVRNTRELESLVVARYPGRTLWLIIQRATPAKLTPVITRLIESHDVVERPTRDNTRVLRVQL